MIKATFKLTKEQLTALKTCADNGSLFQAYQNYVKHDSTDPWLVNSVFDKFWETSAESLSQILTWYLRGEVEIIEEENQNFAVILDGTNPAFNYTFMNQEGRIAVTDYIEEIEFMSWEAVQNLPDWTKPLIKTKEEVEGKI
jgi:hypothetical protein